MGSGAELVRDGNLSFPVADSGVQPAGSGHMSWAPVLISCFVLFLITFCPDLWWKIGHFGKVPWIAVSCFSRRLASSCETSRLYRVGWARLVTLSISRASPRGGTWMNFVCRPSISGSGRPGSDAVSAPSDIHLLPTGVAVQILPPGLPWVASLGPCASPTGAAPLQFAVSAPVRRRSHLV